MREILKLALILFIITAISGIVLATANDVTSDLILQVQEENNNKARQEVLPVAEKFEQLDERDFNAIHSENDKVMEIFAGFNSTNELVGYTVKTIASGYGGDVEIITGVSVEGEITGMKVVKHSETPGLGAKATETDFQNQFVGKTTTSKISVVKSTPKDNEIQAIAGATITSKGVTNAVNLAIDVFNEFLSK